MLRRGKNVGDEANRTARRELCRENAKVLKSSNHYAELITDYYRLIEGIGAVLVRRLLQGLTDDHTETLQQLHEEFSHGGRTVNPN